MAAAYLPQATKDLRAEGHGDLQGPCKQWEYTTLSLLKVPWAAGPQLDACRQHFQKIGGRWPMALGSCLLESPEMTVTFLPGAQPAEAAGHNPQELLSLAPGVPSEPPFPPSPQTNTIYILMK